MMAWSSVSVSVAAGAGVATGGSSQPSSEVAHTDANNQVL